MFSKEMRTNFLLHTASIPKKKKKVKNLSKKAGEKKKVLLNSMAKQLCYFLSSPIELLL